MLNWLFKYLIIYILLFLSFHQSYAITDVDKTIELLLYGNDREREYAAEFLGKLKIKKAIPFLNGAIAKDKSFLVRLASVSSLNKLGEPYDAKIIEEALQSDDRFVRLKAVQVLQGLSEWKNRELVLSLFNDKDVEIRKNIIIAAGKLKIKGALDLLISMLKDPDPEIRESVVISLGSLNDTKALKPLLEILGDSSIKIVRAAVISLGELGDEEISMPMIRMLGHRDKSIRYHAINILGELGTKAGFKAILGMVKDKDPQVRLAAINALGRLKIKEYIPVFQEALGTDTDSYVKLAAAKSLILLEDYTGYSLIKNEVFSKNTDLKRDAIETLGIIKDKNSISIIEDLFIYPNPEIKEKVIWSLGEIKGTSTFGFLLNKLNDEKEFKVEIIDALRKFQDKKLIPYLSSYLDDENFIIRKNAASVLSNFPDKNPEIERKLINLLSDEYFEVRRAALTTLVKWKSKIDLELLNIAKNNSDPLQMTAISGLAELGNKEVIPVILDLSKQKIAERYRLLLAYQLASFGDYSGKNVIIEIAKSDDYVLRKQAAEYLFKFMDADVFDVLSSLIKDNKKEVRSAAVKTLGLMFDGRAVDILLNNLVSENLYFEMEIDNSLINLRDISTDPLINISKNIKPTEKENLNIERAGSILVKIGMPCVDKVIKASSGQDTGQKIYMMNILSRIGKDSLKPLINYWDGNFDPSNNILVDTIIKISKEDPKILIDLLDDEVLQSKSAKLIVRFAPEKVLDLLFSKLYVSSGMVRIKVIECLRGMSGAASDRLITDLFKSDESRQLVIIEVLGEMRTEKAIVPLEKITAETKNEKIKEVAGQVVTNLKNTLSAMANSDKSQIDNLKKKRGKVSMIEKNFIFINLGWKDGVNNGMIFKIFDDKNTVINKLEITEVVGNNTSIGKMLSDTKVEVGYNLEEEVKEADIKATDNDEIKIQLERLKNNNIEIKADAINILGDKGDGSILADIIQVLEDENINKYSANELKTRVDIRKNAAWAIGEIEYKLISKIYKEREGKKDLKDKEQEMLDKITNILIKLFSDADSGVCLAAVRNIIRLIQLRDAFGLKNDFILDPLCNLLGSEDNYVKRAAVEALAELKDPKAIPFLVKSWNDNDATVKGNIAYALEKIGKPAVPSLKEALKDPSDEKKRLAASVLYKLGYKIKRTGNNYEVIE